jgi:alginate O-acetyltransferase complex protein AlgI
VSFSSPSFLIFFSVSVLCFYLLPSRWRKPLLLVASYLFYASWSLPFICVLFLSTSLDFFLSRGIAATVSQAQKKLLLVTGVTMNLLVLCTFKYANLAFGALSGVGSLVHVPVPTWYVSILLPLGISFYTFEAISYLVDVYRSNQQPARSFFEYNLYIMYFPHLVSGPIVRFKQFQSQISNNLTLPTWDRLMRGVELMMLGFIFKCMIADPIANLVDPVFSKPEAASHLSAYVAACAFSAQIYFDFMGYTHIARGASLILNIELPLNFNHPYNARNIVDFWHRWHISLSTWIRDYLYIPLGGSRRGALSTVKNLFVTMGLAGLWHGAAWTFAFWGLYHAALISINQLYGSAIAKLPVTVREKIINSRFYEFACVALTFMAVTVGWVLFRANSLHTADIILSKLLQLDATVAELGSAFAVNDYTFPFRAVILILLCTTGPAVVEMFNRLYRPLPSWTKIQLSATALFFCWILSANELKPFIYFQF